MRGEREVLARASARAVDGNFGVHWMSKRGRGRSPARKGPEGVRRSRPKVGAALKEASMGGSGGLVEDPLGVGGGGCLACETLAHHVTQIEGERLFEQLAMDFGKAAAGDFAEVKPLLQRIH